MPCHGAACTMPNRVCAPGSRFTRVDKPMSCNQQTYCCRYRPMRKELNGAMSNALLWAWPEHLLTWVIMQILKAQTYMSRRHPCAVPLAAWYSCSNL